MKFLSKIAPPKSHIADRFSTCLALLFTVLISTPLQAIEAEPMGPGPYPVGTTNLKVKNDFSDLTDDQVRALLAGHFLENGERAFMTDLLEYPEDAWIINVDVPDDEEVYGPIAGESLPVLVYVNYPTTAENDRSNYPFPFPDAADHDLQHMQGPGEKPLFADEQQRYPLVLVSHGRNVHGIWEIGHARRLASHGYLVVTANYGDLRIQNQGPDTYDLIFRPLAGKAILDHVLSSEDFGSHIDHSRIATSGHSMGGFTSLALAGGRYLDDTRSVFDPRVAAVVAAAPWVGGTRFFIPYYLFGDDNSGLSQVTVPVLAVYGSEDEATPKSSILPAMEQLSGSRYVVELVGQPHVFEGGSWVDLGNWELLFLSAHLKDEAESLQLLQKASAMKGGNEDIQHFDLQRSSIR
jgi:dienelactone hydrolase